MAKKPVLTEKIEFPEGIETSLEGTSLSGDYLKIKGPKGELTRKFRYPRVKIELKGRELNISTYTSNRKATAMVGTYKAHITNMIIGVTNGFSYKLKVVYAHFPITLKQVENIIEVHNFFGEKTPRKAKVMEGATVNLGKTDITVEGINKDAVGQTAANLEKATVVKGKDTRVFQDGIYITEKDVGQSPTYAQATLEQDSGKSPIDAQAEHEKPAEQSSTEVGDKSQEKAKEDSTESEDTPQQDDDKQNDEQN